MIITPPEAAYRPPPPTGGQCSGPAEPDPRILELVCGRRSGQAFWVCTIFMAEVISADTSVMLLGTINVVVASDATLL